MAHQQTTIKDDFLAEVYRAALDFPGSAGQPIVRPKKHLIQAHHWKAAEIERLTEKAAGMALGERRMLRLANPGTPGWKYATQSLSVSVQQILPNEIAVPHRHTANAIRFFLKGSGAYTTVENDKCVMEPGDLIVTPGGEWHDYGGEGNDAGVWLDALDLPLVQYLDAMGYLETVGEYVGYQLSDETQLSGSAAGLSEKRYSAAGLKPMWDSDGTSNRVGLTGQRGTRDDDSGEGENARQTFTPESSGMYYISARANGDGTGTYTLSVTRETPEEDEQTPPVTDVDDAPSFGQQGYTFALAENTDGSTDRVSLGTVSATDPESATLSHSLVGGNESGSFEIDAASGELFYTGGGEDFESGSTQFELMVRASDGDQSADTAVTVNVTDVEEADSESLVSVSEPGGSDLPEGTSTTGRVAVDGPAAGEIQRANDRDWFGVELEAGKTYQIDLSGVRSGGGTLSLPHLRGVYDADGIQVPGIYDPLAFSFANPHNRLGEGISVDVQVFPGEDSKAFFAPDEDGTYYLAVGNFDFSSTGTYTVGVTEIEDDFLRTVDTTGRVEVGSAVTGEIQYANDRDWFAVELTAGVTYKVGLLGEDENGGTLPNPWIRGIHDANGRNVSDTIYYATDPHSNSELIFRPNEDGTYYVAAGSYMSGNGEEEVGTYTLQVSIDDTRVDSTGTSEPDGGDLAADTSMIGRVAVGGSGFGEIGTASDRDWFAVELEASKTYRINTDGVQSGGGTLARARLHNVCDADGNAIPGIDDEPITWRPIHYLSPQEVRNLDGLAFFTPDEDGTYYLEVGSGYFGAYRLE